MKRKSCIKGFTLIEIFIMIMLISLLFLIGIPGVLRAMRSGKIGKVKTDLRALEQAVEAYYLDYDYEYPTELSELIDDTPPFITTADIEDPFSADGSDYVYETSGANDRYFIIYSVGPDHDGSATVSSGGNVQEENGESCIYVSNADDDEEP